LIRKKKKKKKKHTHEVEKVCVGVKWKPTQELKDEYLDGEDQNIRAITLYHLARG
jgi:hypothetical protein